ncbi:MAG TPA: TRAP transporter TatT component family protein [Pyrinomonadaceae bacterium]|jgi:tetratricopeptide (TPR) repeat protein
MRRTQAPRAPENVGKSSARFNVLERTPARRAWSLLALGLFCLALGGCSSDSSSAEAPPAPAHTPDPALLRQADECYAQRADLAQARAGLALLRRARAVAPTDYETTWRIARLAYVIGDRTTDEKERETVFHEGIEAGETAARSAPGRVEGHFWLGANYGGYAQTQGALGGLDAADKVRREMETVRKLDEGLYGGSAYVALGQVDLELPGWLGGDRQRALATLEQGLKYGPQNALLRLQLAKAYLANKRPAEARQQLNFILAMNPNPDFKPEYDKCAAEARELLKKNF